MNELEERMRSQLTFRYLDEMKAAGVSLEELLQLRDPYELMLDRMYEETGISVPSADARFRVLWKRWKEQVRNRHYFLDGGGI